MPQAVEAARRGDQAGWDVLVERFTPLLWAIARGHGLPANAAADVTHTTWLRLVECMDDAPAVGVGEWEAAIARSESMQALRWVDPRPDRRSGTDVDPLRTAVEQLPARCRLALRVLSVSPPPDAHELAAVLDASPDDARALADGCVRRLAEALAETGSIQEE
jgi:DNA-directed RNA polymerase specialized sigma24 family protein